MKKSSLLGLWLLLGTAFPVVSMCAAERLVPSQYATLQDAVDMAESGDTIRIAAGEHPFQALVRNKSLAIVGDPGAVLMANPNMSFVPWNLNVAVLAFERANVVVSNLVIEGHQLANDYPELFMGVIFRSASGRLENCTIRGFRGVSEKHTRAVNVNNALNSATHVVIEGCNFSDNHISAAFFGGNDNPSIQTTTFILRANVFSGIGQQAPFSDVGLWVSYGAGGTVAGNTFTNFIFNAFENNAAGIIAQDGLFLERGFFTALPPLSISENRFSNNSIHMFGHVINGSRITNNVFGPVAEGSEEAGLGVSGANILISDNNFSQMPTALQLFGQGDKLLGVSRGIARNLKVTANWFTNVTNPIKTNLMVSYQEASTQLCCFAPEFRQIEQSGDKARLQVRAWHEQSLEIDSTGDFKQWIDSGGATALWPISEFELNANTPSGNQFFRLRSVLPPLRGGDDAGFPEP